MLKKRKRKRKVEMEKDEIERQLVRIEERIARIPVLREYYCSVILDITKNHPTPRGLMILLIAHVVIIAVLTVLVTMAVMS